MAAGLRRLSDGDAVSEWQRLTVEWKSAQAEYETAAASAISSTATNNDHEDRESAIVKATNRLAEVKREMDALISSARHRRSPTGDSLVVGIVELAAHRHVRHCAGSRTAVSPETKTPILG
jgi:hypothetical protein